MARPNVQFVWGQGNLSSTPLADTLVASNTGRVRALEAGAYSERLQKIGELIEPQADGCWLWTGPLNPKGYGPYRTVYNVLVGSVKRGHVLHHRCEVKACCNPAHLEQMLIGDHVAHHAALRKANA